VRDGQALSSLASGFIGSAEFQSRFGGASSSNGAFVDQLYQNVLGRAGEADGRAFWVNSLDNDVSRADVLVSFSESDENKAGKPGGRGRARLRYPDAPLRREPAHAAPLAGRPARRVAGRRHAPSVALTAPTVVQGAWATRPASSCPSSAAASPIRAEYLAIA
jgi:hypothetical protein